MEKVQKTFKILNLTGELRAELEEYLSSRNIHVVNPLNEEEDQDITHIIVKDISNYQLINETYKVVENNRFIISLSKVTDLQAFTVNNGNMILDDIWFKVPMGPLIMDKYFQGQGSIGLGDNYPAFQEQGSFNVVNPFNTGEYLDRMVHNAFEKGVEALCIKTYFDHLVMYLAGLKNKGRVGLPFEVTYGAYDNIYAVQISFFSDKLTTMDVSTSLSSTLTKKAEDYFLNLAIQSSDFFDFSFMPDVKKGIITALWIQDERITFENRGLMFMNIFEGASLTHYENEGMSSQIIDSSPLEDLSEKIIIPSTLEEEKYKVVVAGGDDQTDDEALLIKGSKELDDLVQTIKGKFEEEDKSVVRIGGSNKLDVDKFAIKIAASVDDASKDKGLKVRSLGGKLPEKIQSGLFDFAKGLGKAADDLNDDELATFQLEKMPDIIKDGLNSQVITIKAQDLSDKNRSAFGDGTSDSAKLLTANVENEKLKSQIKALTSEVRILKEFRTKMSEIQDNVNNEVESLSVKSIGISATKETERKTDEMFMNQFQSKVQGQKALNTQDVEKIAELIESKTKLFEHLKDEEKKTKRLELEVIQQKNFAIQEFAKAERQLKSKSLVVQKTKETLMKLVERKDNEIQELKHKTEQMSKMIASANPQSHSNELILLERQNTTLKKQIEVYETKVSKLSESLQASKTEDNSKEEIRKLNMLNQQIKNQLDVRKRENEKMQLKRDQDAAQILVLREEKSKLEQLLTLKSKDSSAKASTQQSSVSDLEFRQLLGQKQILETQFKDASQKITNLEAKLTEALKPQKPQVVVDDTAKAKVLLEASVKKLSQDLNESRNQLVEFKKESNKLRQEKTSLQNQLDKMKKDAEKAKPAGPKKPGAKAA